MCVVTSASGLVPAAASPSRAFHSGGARNQKPPRAPATTSSDDQDREQRAAPPRLDLVVGRERAELVVRRRFGVRRFASSRARRLRRRPVLPHRSRSCCRRPARPVAGWRFALRASDHRFFVGAAPRLRARCAARSASPRRGSRFVRVGSASSRIGVRRSLGSADGSVSMSPVGSPDRDPGASCACTRRSAPAALRAGWRRPSPHIACRNWGR